MTKVFVACAMSGLNDEQYVDKKKELEYIIAQSDNGVFCEIVSINKDEFQSPREATKKDIKEIENCDVFVLVHLSNVMSSTLFELGIAYALGKEIKIYCKHKMELPFMLRQLDQVSKNVTVTRIEAVFDVVL